MEKDLVEILINAEINADIKKVWESYTNPIHIVNWNFASEDWHCPWAKNDLKVGGKYISRMEAKDGSFGFDFEVIYDEIISGSKIVYHMLDNRKVIIQFQEDNSYTRISILFDAEKLNSVEMQKQGWQAILNNFKNYTESLD